MLEKILRQFSLILLKIRGWKIGPPPKVAKGVIIVIGHTSNWDFFSGLAYATKNKLDVKYTIKKEWLKFPLKNFFLNSGAIGIQRKFEPGEQKIDYITQMINALDLMDHGYISITPEATRAATPNWKTGFYRLAIKTNLPIILGNIDYKRKYVGCDVMIKPKETLEETLKEIINFYKTTHPKFPEKLAFPKV